MARGGTENDPETILVIARGGEVHHFNSAAGETEGHGPEGGLAGPVSDLVHGGSGNWRVSMNVLCTYTEPKIRGYRESMAKGIIGEIITLSSQGELLDE